MTAWRRLTGSVLVTAGSLVGTQVVTAVLGLAWWTVAARQAPVESVGVVAAAVSVMTLLATLSMLGLGTLLISELPRAGRDRGSLAAVAVAMAGAAGLLLGVLGYLALGRFSEPLAAMGPLVLALPLFALGVALTSVTLVLDQAVLASGNGGLQLARNTVASGAKLLVLPLLVLTGTLSGLSLYAAWQVGTAVSLLVLVPRWRRRSPLAWSTGLQRLHALRQAALGHHALNLSLQAPTLLLPLVVALLLSSEENAYFTAVRLLVGFVFLAPFALTIALFARSPDEQHLRRMMRGTIALGVLVSVTTAAVLLVGARFVLELFGTSYAQGGTHALQLLALGGLPLVFKDHYVALRRVQARTADAARLTAWFALLEVAGASVGALVGGVTGVSFGWLVVLLVEGVYCAALLRRRCSGNTPPIATPVPDAA